MEIDFILEKAKELLQKDKKLVPVLFVETEKEISVIGLFAEFGDIDKREMMEDIGRKFAIKGQKVQSISLVSDAYVSRLHMDTKDKNESLERGEAIIVARLEIDTKEKEIMVQNYERSDSNIIFMDNYRELDVQRAFLLDAFVKGYCVD